MLSNVLAVDCMEKKDKLSSYLSLLTITIAVFGALLFYLLVLCNMPRTCIVLVVLKFPLLYGRGSSKLESF